MRTRLPVATWLAICLAALSPSPALADGTDGTAPEESANALADYYGFGPLEVFKLEFRSHSMLAGDFNHDGKNDLAIVDNSHSRIDLLIQRDTRPDATRPVSDPLNVNRIDSHWRFEHRKLPVDREVDAMIAGDFNGDGRTDLAYFGKPDRLIVRFQPEKEEWTEKWETRLADVDGGAWSIAAGDLNKDGRSDLVVLGKQSTYVLLQKAEGGFDTPQLIRNTTEDLRLAMIGDFDGDRREDLFYTASGDGERRVCVRLQTPNGKLGPEYRLELKNPLGITVADIDNDGRKDILAIDSNTRRLGLYRVQRPKAEEVPESKPILYGVGAKAGKRDLGVGDLDGDGLNDVVVSDPDTAQLIFYHQEPHSGLDLGASYPSYLGVEQLRVQDLNGDKKAEVIVLSPKEKTIGVCKLEGDRLTFPAGLPIDGEVLAFELADLNRDGVTEIVYVVKPTGSKSSGKFLLKALSYPEKGDPKPYVFGTDKSEVEFEAKDVGRLTKIDANFDGRPDLLVTVDLGRAPLLLLTDEQGVPQPVTGGGVQLGDFEAGAVFSGRLDKPALLISQGTFARRMQLGEDNRWQVLDQYNATESGAKVKGAAILDLDQKGEPEIVLVDTGTGKLRLYRKEDQLYQQWRVIDLGTFAYQSLSVADLNGDQRDDLLLFGGNRFAVLYTGQTDPKIEERATYESERENAFLVDLAAGDLNNDGKTDLAVVENRAHAMEIVAVLPGPALEGALSFKVFEEKSFHGERGGGMQPREIVIADVTGDGRDDLLLLTHDRILLYPQDDGTSPPEETKTAAADGAKQP